MFESRLLLPSTIWKPLRKRLIRLKTVPYARGVYKGSGYVIDIQLKGGVIKKNIYVDDKGYIEGVVVGGHTGVKENVEFDEDDIIAARPGRGVIASLVCGRSWQHR